MTCINDREVSAYSLTFHLKHVCEQFKMFLLPRRITVLHSNVTRDTKQQPTGRILKL